jgi:hypothetical protein
VKRTNQISQFYKLNHLKMVKRRVYTDVDRYMIEYRMRTPYATPTKVNRSIPDPQSARSIHKHTAHERSHARHMPTEAFYHSEGRINKNSQTKKASIPTQQNHQESLPPKAKESSCCTIL